MAVSNIKLTNFEDNNAGDLQNQSAPSNPLFASLNAPPSDFSQRGIGATGAPAPQPPARLTSMKLTGSREDYSSFNALPPALPETFDATERSLVYEVGFDDLFQYVGPNQGFVQKYPSFFPGRDNEAFAASKQTGAEKLFNGARQFGALAANAFFNNAFSTFDNVAKLTTANFSNFYDTAFADVAAERAMAAPAKYPIYTSAAMRDYEEDIKRGKGNKGLKTVGKYVPFVSPDAGAYWSRFMGQMGFTVGTLGYFALEEAVLGYRTGGVGAAVNAPRGLYKVFNSFLKANKVLDKTSDAIKGSRIMNNIGIGGGYLLRSANVASGEARLEANIAEREFIRHEMDSFMEQYDGKLPTGDDLLAIQTAAKDVGSATFVWQMPVLTMSNIVALNTIIKPRGKYKAVSSRIGKRVVANEGKFTTQKELIKSTLGKTLYGFKQFGKARVLGANVAVEGLEELGQGLASRTSQRYYSVADNSYGRSVKSGLKAFGDEWSKTFNDGVGWDELVSGALMGLVSGGTSYVFKRQGSRDEKIAKAFADDLNKSITLAGNAQVTGVNAMNLYEQTALANEGSIAMEEGDLKRSKDIIAQAQGGLFRTMYRTSKSDEAIDLLFEQYEALDKDNPGLLDNMLGANHTIDQAKTNLKKKYNQYVKDTEDFYFAFNSKVKQENSADFDFLVHQVALSRLNTRDTADRMDNIVESIKENVAQDVSVDSAIKLNELFDLILNPIGLNEKIDEVANFVKNSQQTLEASEGLSEENQKQIRNQIEKDSNYLELLKDVRDSIVDENNKLKEGYQPEIVAQKLADRLFEYDGAINKQELEENIRDLFQLENDFSALVFFSNAMRNDAFFEKYLNGITASRIVYENGVVENVQKSRAEAEGTQETAEEQVEGETLSEQEFDDIIEEAQQTNPDITDEIIDTTVERLRRVTKTADNKFTFRGQIYNTEAEADQAVLNSLGADAEIIAPIFNAAKRRANTLKGQTGKTRQARTSQLTEEEKEELRIAREQEAKNAERTESLPKTAQETSQTSRFYLADLAKGVLTLFFGDAYARTHKSPDAAALILKGPKILAAVNAAKRLGKTQAITLHLNDTLINENVLDVRELSAQEVAQGVTNNITANGLAVVRDAKGRILVLSRANTAEAARNLLATRYNLHIPAESSNNYSLIRKDGLNGPVVGSVFNQTDFTNESKIELGKVKLNDELQVVIPSNEQNQEIIRKFQNETAALGQITDSNAEAFALAFAELRDNLVVQFQRNGVTVGMLSASDFFEAGSKPAERIIQMRAATITPTVIQQVSGGNVVVGTVRARARQSIRNLNYDAQGNVVFTNLKEYERRTKAAPNLNVSIEYFVATSPQILESKNKKKGRTDFDRVSPFRTGAVYVSIKDNMTGQVHLIQAARNDKKTYKPEALESEAFKEELGVAVKPGELPTISSRLEIDDSSLTLGRTTTVKHSTFITRALKGIVDGQANVVVDNLTIPLKEIQVDFDTKIVTAKTLDNKEVVYGFQDITDVTTFNDLNITETNTAVETETAVEEVAPAQEEQVEEVEQVEEIEETAQETPPFNLKESAKKAMNNFVDKLFKDGLLSPSRFTKLEQEEQQEEAEALEETTQDFDLQQSAEETFEEYVQRLFSNEAFFRQSPKLDALERATAIKAVEETVPQEVVDATNFWLRLNMSEEYNAVLNKSSEQRTRQESAILGQATRRLNKARKIAQDNGLTAVEFENLTMALTNKIREERGEFVEEVQEEFPTSPLLDPNVTNPFQILGISEDSTAEQIREAWRTLVKTYHPDLNKDADAMAITIRVNQAYQEAMEEANQPVEIDSETLAVVEEVAVQRAELAEVAESQQDFEETPDSLKDAWLVEQGRVGVTYALGNGSTVKIIAKDEQTGETTVEKDGYTVTVDENGNEVEGENAQLISDELDNNPPTDAELLEILQKDEDNLSLREKIISVKFADRMNALRDQPIQSEETDNFDQYITDSTKKLLLAFGINAENFLRTLALTYQQNMEKGVTPQNLSELMQMAGMNAEQIQTIQDILNYSSYTYLWAYATQAEVTYGMSRTENLRNLLLGIKPEVEQQVAQLEQADVDNMSVGQRAQYVETVKSLLGGTFGVRSVYVENLRNLFGLADEEIKTVLGGVAEFFGRLNENVSEEDMIMLFEEMNKTLRPFNIEVDISSVSKTKKGNADRTVFSFVAINDSAALTQELDDVVMSQINETREELGEALMIPRDNGGLEMVAAEELDNINTAPVRHDIEYLKELLEPYGFNVSDKYVAGLHLVNGNSTKTIYRAMEFEAEVSKEFDQTKPRPNTESAEAAKKYFSENKAQDELDDKMCN